MIRVTSIVSALLFPAVVLTASAAHAQIRSPSVSAKSSISTDHFATSELCSMCHSTASFASALKDERGRAIGPYDLWRTSMMANSSADPLWRAAVAAEVAATPSRRAEIEAKCLRCHTPMASTEAGIAGTEASRALFLDGDSKIARLASDGVSCTVCHQISSEELGHDKSFSGHFKIASEGKIYGPHARPFFMPMFRHTGFRATEGTHVRQSELCASCHTLFTDAVSADGSATGHSLLEQGPFVEWQNSQYNDGGDSAASCQDCHVPTVDDEGQEIQTRIARNPGGRDFPPVRPRSPFGRHVFVGGNTLIPSILRTQLAAGGASDTVVGRLDRSVEQTRRLLRNKTARIRIEDVNHRDKRLEVVVAVENLTGHKLPTAYPSRRVWVRLQVSDADGQILFSSGRFDDRGRIVDGQRRVLPSEKIGGRSVPHFTMIDSPQQVQIYESVMEDAEGDATYLLLRGARYRKDNRLLPLGWTEDHPRGPLTAPAAIGGDENFVSGTDLVRYVIDGLPARGRLTIEASLYYQVLGARYAAELLKHDVPEMKEFAALYAAADPRPELLAHAKKTLAGDR